MQGWDLCRYSVLGELRPGTKALLLCFLTQCCCCHDALLFGGGESNCWPQLHAVRTASSASGEAFQSAGRFACGPWNFFRLAAH